MLLPAVIGAIGFLSTAVKAAPKGTDFKKVRSETVASRNAHRPSDGYFPSLNAYNLTNMSMSMSSGHSTETILYDYPIETVECDTASVLILTTTIDVTVFVTATANLAHTEEPGDDSEAATVDSADGYAHLPSASTDCDDEDSPRYAGPKTATVVEESHSTETEPYSKDELYPVNSNSGLHSYSTRTVRPRPYNTDIDTDTDDPYADHHLSYPVNETDHAPRYPGISPWSTTMGTQASPSAYDDLSASPTQQPEAGYTLPFGGSNNTYTEPSESLQPYGPSKPYGDGTLSMAPASDPATTYTLTFAGSNATSTAPSESAEAYVDQPSYTTLSSHSVAVYTLLFGDSDAGYAEPTQTYAGPEPYVDPSSETPSSHPNAVYNLPSSGTNGTYAEPSETLEPYASPEPHVEPSPVTSTDDYRDIEYTLVSATSYSSSTSALSSTEPTYEVPIAAQSSDSLPYYPMAPSSSSSTPVAAPISSSSSDEPWYSNMPSYY